MPGITTTHSRQPTSTEHKMSTTHTAIQTPIYHPRTPKQLILISPGHSTLGWITHIASLLDPNHNAGAAFQNPQNDPIITSLLSEPSLLKLCKSFNRTISIHSNANVTGEGQVWTAHDEAYHDDGKFGKGNLEREWVVEEVLDDLKVKHGVDLVGKGFDERCTWSLRVVEVEGPFEVRVDEGGHEWVVEVPERRHVFM